METLKSTDAPSIHHQPSNYDEISMHQSLLFSDSLKDLKNLRTQLYSAAEYFELSYTNDDQKQTVVDTLKDYTIKAFVNTVDHLGSVTYKVTDLLDEKVEEVSGTELRVSCIEQRLRTCQEYIDREGLAQQLSFITTPRYHKRYILPTPGKDISRCFDLFSDGDVMNGVNNGNIKYKGCSLDDEDDWYQFRSAVRATIKETPSMSVSLNRRGRSISPTPRTSRLPGTFSFSATTPKKEQDKRTVSPHRFPLLRSGSLASRPTTPKSSRPTTPNPALERQKLMSEQWKSASMRIHDEKEKQKDMERHPSKSKRLLKALLSRRKSKKDETLYTYLDEY